MPFNDQPKRENPQTAQIEREVRELQKELGELQKKENLLLFRPCQGDVELRRKDEALEGFKKRIKSLDEKIWELERKLRKIRSVSGAISNPDLVSLRQG